MCNKLVEKRKREREREREREVEKKKRKKNPHGCLQRNDAFGRSSSLQLLRLTTQSKKDEESGGGYRCFVPLTKQIGGGGTI